MSKYKLAIFDFDGTLFNTHEAIIYCVTKTFESYKTKAPTEQAIYQTITKGVSLEETFKELRNSCDEKEMKDVKDVQEWVDTYRTIYKQEGDTRTKPFEHAELALKHIHSQQIPIVVISNKGIDAINAALFKYNLKSFITFVVGDTKGIKKKPDPMIFNEIIKPKFSSVKHDEIIMIGDTSADILFAKNIGVDACWAMYGYGIPEQCKLHGSKHTIKELIGVLSIFALTI